MVSILDLGRNLPTDEGSNHVLCGRGLAYVDQLNTVNQLIVVSVKVTQQLTHGYASYGRGESIVILARNF